MNKKYVVVLFDGMADYPNAEGKTPMSDADKPTVDFLASHGEVGLCRTVPAGMKPGSDVANLSVMGYDPAEYYTGRSPLEALSMGIKMNPEDVSYRCNIVTLSDDEPYENKTMIDYSAGEITTPEARELVTFLAKNLSLPDGLELYPGVSYRHCLIRRNGDTGMEFTPPHDISDRKITDRLPKGKYADELLSLMKETEKLLKTHPVNLNLIKRGLRTATSIWLWGEGRKPLLKIFMLCTAKRRGYQRGRPYKRYRHRRRYGQRGRGRRNGTIDSNFDGKAAAAIDALRDHDFVYVHLEAPDECGHQGNYAEKPRR
ncbi:MAG: phosphoglycerate mutase [Christensenellales bacterium]